MLQSNREATIELPEREGGGEHQRDEPRPRCGVGEERLDPLPDRAEERRRFDGEAEARGGRGPDLPTFLTADRIEGLGGLEVEATGSAEVRRDGEAIAKLGAGDVFGETGVLEKQLRNADVVATSPMRVMVLSRWDVRRLRKNLPDLDAHIQEVMAQRS